MPPACLLETRVGRRRFAGVIELAHGKLRPWAFDKLAWLLATCPDAKLRDGERALMLVRQASAHQG
jgi:hypothetical protein